MKRSHDVGTLVSGSLTSLGGRLAGKAAYLVLEILAARLLGAESFGEYVIAWSVLRLLGTLSHLGVDHIGLRKLSSHVNTEPGKIARLVGQTIATPLLFGAIFGTALWLLTDDIAPILFAQAEQAYLLLRLAAVGAPLMGACIVSAALTRATKTTKYSALAYDLFQPLSHLVFAGIAFLIFGATALTVLSAALASLLISFGFLCWFVARLYPTDIPIEYAFFAGYGRLIKQSLPVLLVAVSGLLMMWTDILLLAVLSSSESVGHYRVAAQLAFAMTIALPAMNSIIGPLVASLYAEDARERIREIYVLSSKWPLYLVLPAALSLPIIGTSVLETVFGSNYNAAFLPLLVLATGQLINALAGSPGQLLVMSGAQGTWSWILAVSATLNILLNYLLIPHYAAFGAAMATLTSIAMMFTLGLVAVYKRDRLLPFDSRHYKILRSSLAAATITVLGQPLLPTMSSLVTITLIIVLTYAAFFFFQWLQDFDPEDVALLRRLTAYITSA